MYEYRQIIALLKAGESNRNIGKTGLADRNKVSLIRTIAIEQGWLSETAELPDDATLSTVFNQTKRGVKQSSIAQVYHVQIEKWYQQGVQVSTIHAALQREYQFTGSYDCIRRLIKKLALKEVKVSCMLDFKPGECGQVDFGFGPKLIDRETGEEKKTWIFVMTLAWSRHQYAEVVYHQDVLTWQGCHRRAFEFFGGVPEKILIDNAKCAITKACYHDPVVQRAYYEFAQGYGFIVSACPPRDPQKKGRVESGVKYVKNNFVPLRDFKDLADANAQLKCWILETAGNRIHGSTREKPLTLFSETERILLKRLPDVPPECVAWAKVKVHADCHIQYLKCRYSAPYQHVHQTLWLRASETSVRLYHEHQMIAMHVRLFKPGTRTTLTEHLPSNIAAYLMSDPQWCLEQSQQIGSQCHQVVKLLLENSVVDYLRGAQGIVGLSKKYGVHRLNAACGRALAFNSIDYQTIKDILKKGLEYELLPPTQSFDVLNETYTGKSHFFRNITTTMQ